MRVFGVDSSTAPHSSLVSPWNGAYAPGRHNCRCLKSFKKYDPFLSGVAHLGQ
jgi:hypothetical protein